MAREARRRTPTTAAAVAVVAAVTTWVAMLSWREFTVDTSAYLVPLAVLAAVVAGAGVLSRWWRTHPAVVVLTQVVVSGAVACFLLTGYPVPLGAGWSELRSVLGAAMDSATFYAAPVPAGAPGVHPLLILGGLACLLLVDILACTLRRVPLTGLPLLAVYTVPVSLLGGGPSWWIFAASAVGFLTMLFLHEGEQVARWGRVLGPDGAEHPAGSTRSVSSGPSSARRPRAVRLAAGSIGAVTTVLALVVPVVVPALGLNLVNFGRGNGQGSDILVDNPMVDLRRDLTRGEDIPLVQVRTDDPNPSYLRIATLGRFSDNEWSAGDRDIPAANAADGVLPPLLGVSPTVPRTDHSYVVSVSDDFDSTWLPVQTPAASVRAEGDWRFDPQTMDFIASADGLTAAGLSYEQTSVDLDLDPGRLALAARASSLVDDSFTSLPSEMPSYVGELADQVTADASNQFERAVALQDFFRTSGGFVYDLSVEPGNGTDDLERFLRPGPDGRTGYCEQFAAAMAVMAREEDIPARVAVGFLVPERVGKNTYQYSSRDLHAWPELFFAGAGWVRFEPTPATRASRVPAYTRDGSVKPVEPKGRPRNPTSGPSAGKSAKPPADAKPRVQPQATPPADAEQGSGLPWVTVLGVLAALVLLAALLAVPHLVRRRRRATRLAGGPEAVWMELRDTVVDLGGNWPRRRSPRETRNLLIPLLTSERDPRAVAALDRIVRGLELARYSRSGVQASLRSELETCVEALQAGVSASARRRAQWWPRSVLTSHRRRDQQVPSMSGSAVNGVVDHVG